MDIGKILRKLCEQKCVEIIEAETCLDHIHMLVSIPPNLSVAQFMGYLRGKSALMIFDRHANLKYRYGNRHLWCRGYYVDTVGKNRKAIEEYIAEIEKIKTDVPHDDFVITAETPNWKDILAIYAVKATTDFDGVEVVTVDEQKAELIRDVFWDMTELTYETETYEEKETVEITNEAGNTVEQGITVTKTRLLISTKNKTAAEAAVEYNFDDSQMEQLEELINDDNVGLWQFTEEFKPTLSSEYYI